ncbi:acyltransferase family protein [Priestia megaterium]|uniref:acyltransferase family protein n=2 Tax=Priestia megaterium TaxID=1404 RepID=UPI000BF449FF|nr:acyltransferase family protein [Priestia megaterium]MCM3155039.1 acetyltransferase [Priestia megaterium]PFW46660.1 acetyltransferase [Priestia megaterium]
MSAKEKKNRYIYSLDGLRAFAVMSVIAYHLGFGWASGGFLGVDVFFVLSGYLITSILLVQSWENPLKNLKHFWISRTRRLLPAVYVMVVLTAAWVILFNRPLLTTLRGDALSSIFYMSNWWFIFHKVSYFDSFGSPSPLKNLWSLAIEEQFYIVWPLVLLLGLKFIKKRGILSLFILAGVMASAILMSFLYEPGGDPSRIYYGTDTRLFALLIGCLLAFAWPMYRLSSKNLPAVGKQVLNAVSMVSFFVFILCVWSVDEYNHASFLYQGGMLLICLNAAVLVATISHPSSFLGKALSFKPLRWLGTRSYGIYLWHYPVIVLTTPVSEIGRPVYWHALLQVGLTFIIAELSYRYIEVPIRTRGFRYYFRHYHPRELFKWRNLSRSRQAVLGSLIFFLALFTADMTSFAISTQQKDETTAKETEVKIQTNHKENASTSVKDKNKADDKKAENAEKSSGEEKSDAKEKQQPNSYRDVLAIGDSVMLDIAPNLKEMPLSITIDGKVGRQLNEALQLTPSYQAFNNPNSAVIIELGTNGYFTNEELEQLLKAFSHADVYLVNTRVPRSWESTVNKNLKAASEKFDHVTLVDWYSEASKHPEYFTSDGVHLVPEGSRALTKLIEERMNLEVKAESRS